jgi:PAS domain S-box-containing protein
MIDQRGSIVLVNREIERMFGYPREELLGRPIELLVPERNRSEHPRWRGGFVAAPSVRSMGAGRELFGRRKDGSEVPVEIGLTPVATAEGMFVISSVVDISTRREAERERRRLEDQLRQAQKMEAIGRLAAGVAHDFNNVLAAIVGFAELAADADSIAARRDDLGEILSAAERGRQLVDRILRFGRRHEVELRPLPLADTVAEAARLLRATLPASIELDLRLGDAPQTILADATSVHQVLLNLVTNASHAMPAGGKVEIGARNFYVRDSVSRAHPELREGPYALLSVRDTGLGMDPETRARAFEPFFTTKAPGEGSGLGLAMVHAIVRDHGGATWLESAQGEGTTVSVLLPVPISVVEPEPAVAAGVTAGRGERVLLVDDERSLAEAGRRRLERLGYRVEAYSSPLEALDAVRADPGRADLVLSDLSMPGLGGVELARELAAIRADLPVLLLSGYVEDLTERELAGTAIRGVLRKPISGVDLSAALRAVLDES